MSEGIVTVGTTEKQERYGINGDPESQMKTVNDALAKFFDGGQNPFEFALSLNGVELDEDEADQPLRNGDVILAMSKRLASGGVKGA